MERKTKRPLKRSNLNFIYFFNRENKKEQWLANFIKAEITKGHLLNYINFSFINVGSKTLKLDEFIKSETFQNANIIFIEKAYINLIEEENLVSKEVNVLDRESFEVAEKLAGTSNSFYDNVFTKIKEYINSYYGKIKYFQIANINKCKISVTKDVEAIYVMKMESRYFTENNKEEFKEKCKNTLEKSIDKEELNMKRLKIALEDTEKNLKELKDRLGQIDSEIDEL